MGALSCYGDDIWRDWHSGCCFWQRPCQASFQSPLPLSPHLNTSSFHLFRYLGFLLNKVPSVHLSSYSKATMSRSKSPKSWTLKINLTFWTLGSVLQVGLGRALELRGPAEEISISILAYRNEEFESHSKKRLGCEWEIGVHLSRYLPRPFSTAVDTAIMGPSQDLPLAKYSLWVDTRRILEQPKPLSAS